MSKQFDPLSVRALIAGVLIATMSGLVVTYLSKQGRFAEQPATYEAAKEAREPPAVAETTPATKEQPAADEPVAVKWGLTAADETAVFKAAGFERQGDQWIACDSWSPSYSPGAIERVQDVNGDGRLEVMISEGGALCYGTTGVAHDLVSKQADGSWKLIGNWVGIPSFIAIKNVDGWPDIEVGGPGFCFPVERWNGHEYVFHRWEYDGQPCSMG